MKTTQRGFFTEEQWEAFLKSDKQDKDFLDQVVKRWEEAADLIAELEAENEQLRELLEDAEDYQAELLEAQRKVAT